MKRSTKASLCSLILPGAGLWYMGRRKSAAINLLVALVIPALCCPQTFLRNMSQWIFLASGWLGRNRPCGIGIDSGIRIEMSLRNPAGIDSMHQIKLEELLHDLSRKCAFPMAVEDITVRQTHISMFLAGDVVYKVKKAVKLPFLDFSTVELRHHFCEEEIRVNRPWAPGVYLGVVPITREADGLRFEGAGPG